MTTRHHCYTYQRGACPDETSHDTPVSALEGAYRGHHYTQAREQKTARLRYDRNTSFPEFLRYELPFYLWLLSIWMVRHRSKAHIVKLPCKSERRASWTRSANYLYE